MRNPFRFLLTAALVLSAAAGSRAQPFSPKNVFTFAPAPAPRDLEEKGVPRDEIDKKLGARAEIKVRPNAATELYLWVLNPNEDKDTFVVEVKGPDGSPAVKTPPVAIPGKTWAHVKLPKAAPPVPPAAATPAAAPAPTTPAAPPAAPAAEPPPPGTELPVTRNEARLTFRLLDKNGAELKDDNGLAYGRNFPVAVLTPSDYVKTPVTTLTLGPDLVALKAVVAQEPTFPYPGSAPVELVIPPQDATRGAVLREGFYRRTLTFGAKEPATLTGVIEGLREKARVYVGVDGIDRAFTYILNPLGKTPATQLIPNSRPAVRVSLAASPVRAIATQPVPRFPIRVEVDNPSTGDLLELRLQPAGTGPESREVVKLEGTRETKVWLETAADKGGLLFTTRSRDWVKPLDLSHLRGRVEITGVLETADRVIFSDPISVMVDGTPPEGVVFLPVPEKLEKGKPLPVAAMVIDPETDVAKATFFLCRALDDGKMPADAIKAVGVPSPKNPAVWTADLKVPDDFRGPGLVGVQFTNGVGLANELPRTQRVQIVDAVPKVPLGTIEGKVEYGGRLQPGVAVTLKDMDGKDKGAAVTNDKGVFVIKNVPPGNYVVGALKKDSSYGAAGAAPVQVEADKVAKPTVGLNKVRG